MPVGECLRFFWGVKKWKLSYDYDFHVLIDDDSTGESNGNLLGSEITSSGSVELISGDIYNTTQSNFIHDSSEKETDLFCKNIEAEGDLINYIWTYPATYTRKTIKNEGTEEDPEIVTTITNFQSNLIARFGAGEALQDDFLPRFSKTQNESNEFWINLILRVTVGSGAGVGAKDFNTPISPYTESISASFNFLDYEIPIALGANAGTIPERVLVSEVSNVVIEPYEWWTYDGKYNSETGLEN